MCVGVFVFVFVFVAAVAKSSLSSPPSLVVAVALLLCFPFPFFPSSFSSVLVAGVFFPCDFFRTFFSFRFCVSHESPHDGWKDGRESTFQARRRQFRHWTSGCFVRGREAKQSFDDD